MAANMSEGSSASMDGRCPRTDVRAQSTQQASRNKEHLSFLPVYDRYLVSMGRKIGEGGQGCVYEAKLHLPYFFKPLPVVVKKFEPFVGVSQGHFPREMSYMQKSFNLCMPLGVFFEGDSLCMILRRFSCDLRAAIDSRVKALRDEGFGIHCPPFTEQITRFIITTFASALKSLHECGVYHRDLKVDNVLVMIYGKNYGTSFLQLGHLAIADFERSEGVVGTAFWCAPEVLRSLITEIPLSKEQWLLADIFSFGMVCYEVLTGMIPFDGHPLSDYGLVLNGGRPELPDHVPEPMRDLVMRCWHADPHSRPTWTDIMEVLMRYDHDRQAQRVRIYLDQLGSLESLSCESLIHESKQLVRDLTVLHESDSKSFRSEFMPHCWSSEFIATAEEYASKFEADFSPEKGPLMCNVQELFERVKRLALLKHQANGAGVGSFQFVNLMAEQQLGMLPYANDCIPSRQRLQAMLATILEIFTRELSRVEPTEEIEGGTSWTERLLFFHALVKWVLWYEHVEVGNEREFIMTWLIPNHWSLDTAIEALLIFLCLIVNTYIYVLAMVTYEPILLVLQYGL